MMQNIPQHIASYAVAHPIKFGASALCSLVAIECAIFAIRDSYKYCRIWAKSEKNENAQDADLKNRTWQDLKVDFIGLGVYGFLASNTLSPYSSLIGVTAFIGYAYWKIQIPNIKQNEVYKMTWMVGSVPTKIMNVLKRIWEGIKHALKTISRIFHENQIEFAVAISLLALAIKGGMISAALKIISEAR